MPDDRLQKLEELLFLGEKTPEGFLASIGDKNEGGRTEKVTVRMQQSEKNTLLLNAGTVPLSTYIRSRLFGYEKLSPPVVAPTINRDLYVQLLKFQQQLEPLLKEARIRQKRGLDSEWSDRALMLNEHKRLVIELRKEIIALSTEASE